MVNSSAWLARTKFFIVLGILCPFYVFILCNRRDFENGLIKKLNAKRFLKYFWKTFYKVNDVLVLHYTIIKLESEKV